MTKGYLQEYGKGKRDVITAGTAPVEACGDLPQPTINPESVAVSAGPSEGPAVADGGKSSAAYDTAEDTTIAFSVNPTSPETSEAPPTIFIPTQLSIRHGHGLATTTGLGSNTPRLQSSNPNRGVAVTFVTSPSSNLTAVRVYLPRAKDATAVNAGSASPLSAENDDGSIFVDVRSTGAIKSSIVDRSQGAAASVPSEQELLLSTLRGALSAPDAGQYARAFLSLRIGCLRLTMHRAFETLVMCFIIWSSINLALDSVGLHVSCYTRRSTG